MGVRCQVSGDDTLHEDGVGAGVRSLQQDFLLVGGELYRVLFLTGPP